jgi:predicted RNA-binding protein with TRAM domain
MMSFGQRGGGFGSRGGSGGSSGGFGSFKKPVEVGKEYNVTISDTSRRGEGIAKIDGFVIFVPGTRMGQTARIKVTQVSERFANGQVVEQSSSSTTAPAGAAPAASQSVEENTTQ